MPGADAARTALMGGTDMPSQGQTAAPGQRQKRGRAEARPRGGQVDVRFRRGTFGASH
jgi:hypothetical protein